jgi:hypothetical protein
MISDPKMPLAGDSPGLTQSEKPESSAYPAPVATRSSPSSADLWLRRVAVLLFVFLCATIGVMLMILPWRPEWADNHLLQPYPWLRAIFDSGFTRGVCTGLGVLNIWIGFWEAIQYREEG